MVQSAVAHKETAGQWYSAAFECQEMMGLAITLATTTETFKGH